MTPEFGDIVEIKARGDGVRWVMSPSGSASHNHVPNVRLLRHGYDGAWLSHTVTILEVRTIERPTFAVDERVVVGDRAGTIISLGEEAARVKFDPMRHPLKGGGTLRCDGETDTPYWRLALDNRL